MPTAADTTSTAGCAGGPGGAAARRTTLANGCFGARTDQVSYTVSERKLLLTSGARVIRDEPMVAFKDYRVATAAPVSARIEQLAG